MTTQKINSVKQTLGFFSMTIAWTLMNILHSFYLTSVDGKADDSGVVIFWSGLFIALAWVIFIIYPLKRLDHSRRFFKPTIFPIGTTIYAALTYSIIVGGLFRSLDLVLMFMPLAALAGFLFGLTYSLIIRSEKIIDLLYNRPLTKIILFLSPVLILTFFLWLLPAIAPSLVFRYTTDEVRTNIIRQTIPKFKVGDDFEPLRKALPGYLDHIDNGSGNMSATMENFAFVIQVNCNKIIRLEFGESQFDIDGTIYGKLQETPCP